MTQHFYLTIFIEVMGYMAPFYYGHTVDDSTNLLSLIFGLVSGISWEQNLKIYSYKYLVKPFKNRE